ncbi:helix-turn-helix domain-containing protein [Kitasatospora sp. LaBMicrA B282]|uniref:helix-turn-helix domain-containing protein n=1 Tax=Kitasatospora sp. LaBMicrA B282 TaxID=3420949 RepID=UPI003D0C2476
MTAPNETLRGVRLAMRLSQDEFARRLRQAGDELRDPNEASKRLVQRWESGESQTPRPVYLRALEAVTGQSAGRLGFDLPEPVERVREDGRGGHDLDAAPAGSVQPQGSGGAAGEDYSGVWLSRYEFYSSSRGDTYVGLHHVLLTQRGNRIEGRSLGPNAAEDGRLTLDLTVDRSVVTGTWVEETEAEGYYRGARYHGAFQFLADPTGRRMAGKWVGFGKELDVNSGPWELRLLSAAASPELLARYRGGPDGVGQPVQ